MKFKLVTVLTIVAFVFSSCGNGKKVETQSVKIPAKKEVKQEVEKVETPKDDLMLPTLDNKGIGPIKSLKLGEIDSKMVAKGKELYKANCTACHKFKKRFVGPLLNGITVRRSPEWIMNMILNPEEMSAKDPVAKALLAKYNAPMANQSLKEADARAILEYFRSRE
ncbi:MAG: c-type cytochrome [Flavobacteriaceae bacterium]|nr:c-type cytochrome [Flavobacteriaceae bacterium]